MLATFLRARTPIRRGASRIFIQEHKKVPTDRLII